MTHEYTDHEHHTTVYYDSIEQACDDYRRFYRYESDDLFASKPNNSKLYCFEWRELSSLTITERNKLHDSGMLLTQKHNGDEMYYHFIGVVPVHPSKKYIGKFCINYSK